MELVGIETKEEEEGEKKVERNGLQRGEKRTTRKSEWQSHRVEN